MPGTIKSGVKGTNLLSVSLRGEAIPAQGAPVIARLEMDAVVVTVQIRLALELFAAGLVADHGGAGMRIFALRVVSFHVRFPVVAAFEELAADSALVGGFLGSGPLALLLDSVDAGKRGRARVIFGR